MKKATGKERKEAELWDEIRALYDKILYWFYEQEDAAEARVYARKLEPLLKKVSPHHETILGEECWSLVHELKGNYREAIRYRENEIRLIERLHELAAGKPNGHAILKRYDHADLCDRLELLAILEKLEGDFFNRIHIALVDAGLHGELRVLVDLCYFVARDFWHEIRILEIWSGNVKWVV